VAVQERVEGVTVKTTLSVPDNGPSKRAVVLKYEEPCCCVTEMGLPSKVM
jgi:hypothetical protein